MSAPQLSITARLLSDDRQAEAIEARIAQYLRLRSGVTLIELARDIPGFLGDETWGYEEQNIIVWQGLSRVAIDAMLSMISSQQITPTVTTWLVYSFDGQIIGLPIAERIKRYSDPHWLPVVFAGNREVIDGRA